MLVYIRVKLQGETTLHVYFPFRVVDAVCIWIRTAKAELLKDLVFLKLLHELQDRIAEDGLANHLTTTLADSIKESATKGSGVVTGSPLLPIRVRSVRGNQ